MSGKRTVTARLVSQPDEPFLMLEDILNDTSDPEIKRTFSLFFREEVKAAEERAVYRLAQKFRHRLPVKQQMLLDQSMCHLAAPVSMAV